jgi:hypothetical protein
MKSHGKCWPMSRNCQLHAPASSVERTRSRPCAPCPQDKIAEERLCASQEAGNLLELGLKRERLSCRMSPGSGTHLADPSVGFGFVSGSYTYMPQLECTITPALWPVLQTHAQAVQQPIGDIVGQALAQYFEATQHTIYQVSTATALVEGVYQGAFQITNLREHGDLGLGTFEELDGEMVILDGKFYQVRCDGSVREVGDDARTPFAVITRFSPEAALTRVRAYELFEQRGHEQGHDVEDWLDHATQRPALGHHRHLPVFEIAP